MQLMPQLDIFIFSHIIIQSTMAFLLIALFIWNTALINLFTSLKTRQKYLKLLTKESVAISGDQMLNKLSNENNDMLLIETEMVEFIKTINHEK